MFTALHQKLGKKNPSLFTVTVGRKPSEAERYLDEQREVKGPCLLLLASNLSERPP